MVTIILFLLCLVGAALAFFLLTFKREGEIGFRILSVLTGLSAKVKQLFRDPLIDPQNGLSLPEKMPAPLRRAEEPLYAAPVAVDAPPSLEEKFEKMSQMLDEKNRLLARLEEDLRAERAQRGDFEGLQSILQKQISELKGQTKRNRDELSAVLQENNELRTRVKELERSGRGEEVDIVMAAHAPRAFKKEGDV